MRNIKLILEYDGTAYSGWQSQTNARAVQDVVREAIEKMTEEKVNLMGASRTDSGVHALGQVATFQTARQIPCEGFLKGLNNFLPEDVRIHGCEEVPLLFHPTTDAKRKTYRYLLEIGDVPSALERNRAWWVGPKLDLKAMRAAAKHLIGEHDFQSFRGPNSDIKTTVRWIQKIVVGTIAGPAARGAHPPLDDPTDSSLIKSCSGGIDPLPSPAIVPILFEANGFLKYMVRNIVGTLVDVGRRKLKPSTIKNILEAKDRRKAGFCAPPQGLYLVKVEY